MMENLVLECKGLRKSYGKKEVLRDVNLKLESGKIYGLIGRNGAGKTTLLSVLTAQNPATDGEITINGEKIWENEKALKNFCFSREIMAGTQDAIAFMKGKDYLKAASIYFPYWDGKMAEELIKEFGLDVKKPMVKLSKGMLSMITIIIALASKAPFTILDEPVAGLDVFMRKKFYQLLLEEYTRTGRTFLISTHIIEEAADVLEEVIILHDGKILLKENTQELVQRSFRVSGLESEVEKAVKGLLTCSKERTGRGMGITVMLKEGEAIDDTCDVTIQPVSLSDIFVALCSEKEETYEQ